MTGVLMGTLGYAVAAATSYWLSYYADASAANLQNDSVQSVATDTSGNVYTTGFFRNTSTGGVQAFVSKADSLGAVLWQRSLTGGLTTSAQVTRGYGVAVDSSGNVYVCGAFKNTSNGFNAFVAKYNTSGTIQWQRVITNPSVAAGSQSENAYALAVDSSGNVFVGVGNAPTVLFKYNTSGVLQWQRQYFGPSSSTVTYVYGLSVDSSGNCYLGSRYNSSTPTAGFAAVYSKFDTSGTLLASNSLTTASPNNDSDFRAITVDSSGNIYVTGHAITSAGTYNEILTAKYNSSGTLQWQRYLTNAAGNDIGLGIVADATGCYLTGLVRISAADDRVLVAKYNTSGTLQWQRSIKDGNTFPASQGNAITNIGSAVLPSGYFKNSSNGFNALVTQIPNDGSKTGTYVVGSQFLTYDTASMVDTAGTATTGTPAMTASTGGFTDSAGSLTDAALTLTAPTVAI